MKHKPLLSFLFVCCFFFSKAQLSDKLHNDLPTGLRPAHKTQITHIERALIISGIDGNILSANQQEIDGMVAMSKSIIDTTTQKGLKVLYNKCLGDFYVGIGDYDLAYTFYEKTTIYGGSDTVYSSYVGQSYAQMATYYSIINKADTAVDLLHKALDHGNQKDSTFMCSVFNCYQSIYTKLLLRTQALEYSKNYLAFTPRAELWQYNYTNFVLAIAGIYTNMYSEDKKQQNVDSALHYINLVFEKKKDEETTWFSECYKYLGDLKFHNGQYKEAIPFYDSCLLTKYIDINNRYPSLRSDCQLNRAIALVKSGHPEAIKIIDTIQIIGKRNFLSMRRKSKALFEYAQSIGDWKKAFDEYNKYVAFGDSLDLAKTRGRIFEANQKYSVAKKEIEIKNLENKSLLQEKSENKIRSIAIIVSLALLLFIILGYAFYKRDQLKQTREKQQLTETLNKVEADFNNERINLQEDQIRQIKDQRYRISADIHDGINSGLAALKFYVADLKQTSHDNQTQGLLDNIESELESLYLQAREFLHKLSTEKVDANYSVANLLGSLKEKFDIISILKVNTSFSEEELNKHLSENQQKQLCMVIQEAVTNIIKYANATIVSIDIKINEGLCSFTIKDDGYGFNTTNAGKGLGLKSMENRIDELNGKLSIESDKSGTAIEGEFPIV